MSQVQIFTGVERRRRWSAEQKRAVVEAAFAPGAVVAAVARQADINTGLIYRWRRELRQGPAGFAAVVVSAVPDRAVACGVGDIAVSIGAHIRARIPSAAPPELAAAVVKALVGRSVGRSPGSGPGQALGEGG
jgi:transposase